MLPYSSATPLLGIYPKEIKSVGQRGICNFVFIAELFTTAKKQKMEKMETKSKSTNAG